MIQRTHNNAWVLPAHIAATVLFASGVVQAGAASKRSAAELMDVLMWNREPVGGPFALFDHTGKRRTDADFRGKPLLIYFGFTYCPAVCPTDIQSITSAVDQLGTRGDAVQPLFITVDPDRDTPEHLAQYVPSFHPRPTGLTGAEGAVRQVADAYKVYFEKIPPADTSGYNVDHSGFIYLMDANGRYLGFFPPGTTADRLVHVIQRHLPSPQLPERRRATALYFLRAHPVDILSQVVWHQLIQLEGSPAAMSSARGGKDRCLQEYGTSSSRGSLGRRSS